MPERGALETATCKACGVNFWHNLDDPQFCSACVIDALNEVYGDA